MKSDRTKAIETDRTTASNTENQIGQMQLTQRTINAHGADRQASKHPETQEARTSDRTNAINRTWHRGADRRSEQTLPEIVWCMYAQYHIMSCECLLA